MKILVLNNARKHFNNFNNLFNKTKINLNDI